MRTSLAKGITLVKGQSAAYTARSIVLPVAFSVMRSTSRASSTKLSFDADLAEKVTSSDYESDLRVPTRGTTCMTLPYRALEPEAIDHGAAQPIR